MLTLKNGYTVHVFYQKIYSVYIYTPIISHILYTYTHMYWQAHLTLSDFFYIALFFSNNTNSMISLAIWNLGQRLIRPMRLEQVVTGGYEKCVDRPDERRPACSRIRRMR
jgi:hypothetical protein